MTDDALTKLKQSTMNIHPDMICRGAVWVLLPFSKFTVTVWGTTETGPDKMDKIFFQLLRHGVNTRIAIASRLGVDEDEFIFTHLDIMVREGYVFLNSDKYGLTQKGEQFCGGDFKEERLQKHEKFRFVWNDVGNRVEDIGSENNAFRSKKIGRKIKHADLPPQDELVEILKKHFNQVMTKEKVAFYNIDSSGQGEAFHTRSKLYQQFAALFYAPKQGQDGVNDRWHLDLRVYSDEDAKFILCNDIIKKVNKDEYWREQFEEIYKEILNGA